MSTSYEMNRTLLYLRLRLLLACTLPSAQREEVDAVELNVSRSPQTLTHSRPMAAGQAWGEVATLPNHQVGQEQLLRAARCLKRQQSKHSWYTHRSALLLLLPNVAAPLLHHGPPCALCAQSVDARERFLLQRATISKEARCQSTHRSTGRALTAPDLHGSTHSSRKSIPR